MHQAVRAFIHIMPADSTEKHYAGGIIDAQLSGTLYRLPSLSRNPKYETSHSWQNEYDPAPNSPSPDDKLLFNNCSQLND